MDLIKVVFNYSLMEIMYIFLLKTDFSHFRCWVISMKNNIIKIITIIIISFLFFSCILWGVVDNIILSKFGGQFINDDPYINDSKISINGDYLLVTSPGDPLMGTQNGFLIIDVSDPFLPTLAGAYSPPNDVWITNIWGKGDYAYCTTENSFMVVDRVNLHVAIYSWIDEHTVHAIVRKQF